MNKAWLILLFSIASFKINAQVTAIAPGEYKNIAVQNYSNNVDYTNCLILLHEASDSDPINANYAVGTITALRGSAHSWNRINLAAINSSSAYNSITASVTSIFNNADRWKLKTCMFNGRKYLAVEIPYNASHHDHGYKFTGWTVSTGENMLAVPFKVNDSPVNESVLSNIQDFVSNQTEVHDVQQFNVTGEVIIGTSLVNSKLSVNGNIRAKEIKVENASWPDYVFTRSYQLPTLQEMQQHIKEKGHLQGIPSAVDVKANGIDLGEMNAKLLQKIEELTLHLIEQNRRMNVMQEENEMQKRDIRYLKSKYN